MSEVIKYLEGLEFSRPLKPEECIDTIRDIASRPHDIFGNKKLEVRLTRLITENYTTFQGNLGQPFFDQDIHGTFSHPSGVFSLDFKFERGLFLSSTFPYLFLGRVNPNVDLSLQTEKMGEFARQVQSVIGDYVTANFYSPKDRKPTQVLGKEDGVVVLPRT